jgi:hypothetical protein
MSKGRKRARANGVKFGSKPKARRLVCFKSLREVALDVFARNPATFVPGPIAGSGLPRIVFPLALFLLGGAQLEGRSPNPTTEIADHS